MAGLVNFIGKEQTIEALGRNWKLARLELNILDEWMEWAKEKLPDCLEAAHRHVERLVKRSLEIEEQYKGDEHKRLREKLLKTIDEEQEYVVRQALNDDQAGLSLDAPRIKGLYGSIAGLTHLFYLLLKVHQPDVTTKEAGEIVAALGREEIMGELDKAGGVAPPNPPDPPAAA